jgi:hypothetical protein
MKFLMRFTPIYIFLCVLRQPCAKRDTQHLLQIVCDFYASNSGPLTHYKVNYSLR